jgi:FixJ family two-component response regulator
MIDPGSVVFVVDDDASVRDALCSLLTSVGLHAEVFGSAEEFLAAVRPEVPSCLVLDIRLPGSSGLEFQDELARTGMYIPIIFITAHGDIPMTRRAMKAGAVEFLTKPFQKDELLGAIRQAIERDRVWRVERAEASVLLSRFETLTPREREVMKLVVTGLPNKQTAAELGVTEITIKVHRGHVMQKMQAGSLAELVRMADRLSAEPPKRKTP